MGEEFEGGGDDRAAENFVFLMPRVSAAHGRFISSIIQNIRLNIKAAVRKKMILKMSFLAKFIFKTADKY